MITLDSNPSDAPCCRKVIDNDSGRSVLVHTDWDWPGLATTFGWSISQFQNANRDGDFEWFAECGVFKCEECNTAFYPMELENGEQCQECSGKCVKFRPCDHRGTDGTVGCNCCKITSSQFIQAAGQWLDDNDGEEAEDPGYFSTN